ncbi:hypothetical protein HD554DRAFT_2173850 [Boletus coccyginus]|nr:hypothetical protein HD554DRAFT_2173850 [Boletus coccyginus]
MRPLVHYDLDEPPTTPFAPAPTGPHANTRQPPKKRKRQHHNAQNPGRASLQHWDDPGSTAFGVIYDDQEGSGTTPAPIAAASSHGYADDVEEGEEFDGEEDEESRALTQDEIWDDAALIDAWNSAEAEYEAYHGTSKAWKTQPVKKSPLWYNKPYTAPTPQPGPSNPKPHSNPLAPGDEPEPDTVPLDFHTYIPTHDPSLAVPSDTGAGPAMTAPFFVPPPSTTMVSRNEAFNNALSAMYWGGYWTAVYHYQSQTSGKSNDEPVETTEEDGIEADDVEDEEDLVPAQR